MITGMGRMVWKSGATYSGGTMNILPQNAFIQAYTKIYTENRTSINYKYGRKFTVVQDRF